MNKGFENQKLVPVSATVGWAAYGESESGLDPDKLESPEIRALIAETEKRCEQEARLQVADAVRRTLVFMIEAKDSRRAAYQLAYAVGMGALVRGSAAQVAKKFGQSREAFEQEGEFMLESLMLRKAPNEKRPEASEEYQKRNYRKGKIGDE